MDFNTSLRRAIKTGNVVLGTNETLECIQEGKAQLVVFARNAPAGVRSAVQEQENLRTYTYDGSSVELGMASGKPFMVSALAVVDPGESDILEIQ